MILNLLGEIVFGLIGTIILILYFWWFHITMYWIVWNLKQLKDLEKIEEYRRNNPDWATLKWYEEWRNR